MTNLITRRQDRDAAGMLGVMYARDFGVVGDGNENDAEDINRALVSMAGYGGGYVYLPAGATCLVRSPILLPSNVYLVVPAGTTVLLADTTETHTIRNANQDTGNSNCGVIGGGTIDGNRAGQATASANVIDFQNVSGGLIADVVVQGGAVNGVSLIACDHVHGRNVTATDCGTHGVYLQATDECRWDSTYAFDNSRVATAGVGDGVHLELLSTDNVFANLVAYDSYSAGKRQGYGFREAASSLCDRNLVTMGATQNSATGRGNLTGAASLDGAASIAIVGGNPTALQSFSVARGRVQEAMGASVASANQLTLGSDGNSFHITGTTQINLISATGWQSGSIVHLVFDASVTVAHAQAASGAFFPILLAGAANLSATANDTLTLLFDGVVGRWIELARTVI